MDNLTHSLVGLLVGETAATVSATAPSGLPAAKKRVAMLGLMLVGSNFPDFDVLYTALTRSKLDYLLQHRGYTHTIVGALVATALMLGVCELWLRRGRLLPTAKDRLQLLVVALLAPLLHIALDYTNSYGVHPFWPFYDGWMYGDSVFIVEPLLWGVAAPLAFLLRSRPARYAIMFALLAGAGLCFFSGLVPWFGACVYLLVTVVLLALGKYAAPRTALLAGIGCWALITIVFASASHLAGKRIESLAAEQFPEAVTLDHVLTPMPVNPLCWDIILVQQDALHVILRRATMSLSPAIMRADRCPDGVAASHITAPLRAIAGGDVPAIRWKGEVATSLSTLRGVVAMDCRAREFMRFARAPWAGRFTTESTIENMIIGDLRYDREPGEGFAELTLGQTSKCPSHVPPWLPPRGDLLRAIPAASSVPTSSASQ